MRGLGTWFCEAVTPHPPASAGTFSHWEKEHPTTTATPCRAATRSRRSETQPVRRRSKEKGQSPRCHHSWLSPSDGRQRRRAQEVAAEAFLQLHERRSLSRASLLLSGEGARGCGRMRGGDFQNRDRNPSSVSSADSSSQWEERSAFFL